MWNARARQLMTLVTASAAALLSVCGAAWAAFPDKPLRIIVPFTAGSGTDWIGRAVADELTKTLGQPVIVENKAGADGRIGTDFVVKSPADGYTLVITSSATHSANPGLIRNLSYDPVKDFAHVSLLITDPLVFAVHPSVAGSVAEFINVAKTRKLSFGYGSNSSLVAASTFNKLAKVEALAVPYKSQPQAATDTAGGQVNYLFSDATAIGAFLKGGRLRALAMTGARRSEQLPDVPTLAEQGIEGFDLQVWVGLAAPAGTPAEVMKQLNAEVRKVMTRADVREKFRVAGKTVAPNSIEEQTVLVQRQLEAWSRRIADAGLKAE